MYAYVRKLAAFRAARAMPRGTSVGSHAPNLACGSLHAVPARTAGTAGSGRRTTRAQERDLVNPVATPRGLPV